MSIFCKRQSSELISGIGLDTLRFNLEPTRIGRWFGYKPVTQEYLTNGGIWFFYSDGERISNCWILSGLHDAYQSEKMKQLIELNKPLKITITNQNNQ